MSIKIRFEQGPTVVQTTLKDDAMAQLMAIVQEQALTDAVAPAPEQPPAPLITHMPPTPQTVLNPESYAKDWLAKHGAAEVLNKLAWVDFSLKIVALGAYHESKAGEGFESWRSADIVTRFAEAKDSPPTNFPRDIATAIKRGFVTTITPRTYAISRTGWIEVSTAISKLPREYQDGGIINEENLISRVLNDQDGLGKFEDEIASETGLTTQQVTIVLNRRPEMFIRLNDNRWRRRSR